MLVVFFGMKLVDLKFIDHYKLGDPKTFVGNNGISI